MCIYSLWIYPCWLYAYIVDISIVDISMRNISIVDVSTIDISNLDTSGNDISRIYTIFLGYILHGCIRGYIRHFDISIRKKIYLLLDISIDFGCIQGYIRNLDTSIVDISEYISWFWIHPWIYPNNSLLSCHLVETSNKIS